MKKERFYPEKGWVPVEEEEADLKKRAEAGKPLSKEERERLEELQTEKRDAEHEEKKLEKLQKEWKEDTERGYL